MTDPLTSGAARTSAPSRRSVLLGLGLAPVLSSCARLVPGMHWSGLTPGGSPVAVPTPGGSTLPSPGTSASPSASREPASRPAGDAQQVWGELDSRATGQRHPWVVLYPPGSSTRSHLPVAIMLHGFGDDVTGILNLKAPQQLGAAMRRRVPPFAVAAISGGKLFWQPMGSQNAAKMVSSEFLGLLAARGLDTSRLAIGGWSMGGWGTLRFAQRELHGRLRAIAPMSTPCYPGYDTFPEPEDMTRAQFDANNFYNHPELLTGLPIHLSCGTSDEFAPGNQAFANLLAATPGVGPVTTSFTSGGHSWEYWRSIAAAQFDFLGGHLAG